MAATSATRSRNVTRTDASVTIAIPTLEPACRRDIPSSADVNHMTSATGPDDTPRRHQRSLLPGVDLSLTSLRSVLSHLTGRGVRSSSQRDAYRGAGEHAKDAASEQNANTDRVRDWSAG
jgi:hypothetical protein